MNYIILLIIVVIVVIVVVRWKNESSITYLWGFKPNEKHTPNQKIITYNKRWKRFYNIIYPDTIDEYLTYYSNLEKSYQKISDKNWVVKTDIARLLYLYHKGGLYLDMDCEIMIDIPSFNGVILFIEKTVDTNTLGPREEKNSVRIANYAIYSKNKHDPFIKNVLEECMNRLNQIDRIVSHEDILWVCGPDVITTVYHRTKHIFNIKLLGPGYIKHYATGSWR